jgi:hypothetical protein
MLPSTVKMTEGKASVIFEDIKRRSWQWHLQKMLAIPYVIRQT